jgi:hypothetical protein
MYQAEFHMDGIPKRRETHGLLFLRTYTRWSFHAEHIAA